jgi:hypothetical protein
VAAPLYCPGCSVALPRPHCPGRTRPGRTRPGRARLAHATGAGLHLGLGLGLGLEGQFRYPRRVCAAG